MIRLLNIELTKIMKNRASKVLVFGYFILLSFIALIASVKIDIGFFKLHLAEQGIFNFPYIWHFNTYIASIFKLFLAVVIVSMISNEYSYGTLKQNLIDGMSKKEFIASKFITILFFSALSTLFIIVLSLILGYSFSSYTELSIVFSDWQYVLAFFVKLVGFFSICMFVSLLIKRSAFALGFLILWNVIEFIIMGLLRFEIFPDNETYQKIGILLPIESMSQLIKEPFSRLSVIKNMETTITQTEVLRNYNTHWHTFTIAIIWTLIMVFLSYRLLKKRDL